MLDVNLDDIVLMPDLNDDPDDILEVVLIPLLPLLDPLLLLNRLPPLLPPLERASTLIKQLLKTASKSKLIFESFIIIVRSSKLKLNFLVYFYF